MTECKGGLKEDMSDIASEINTDVTKELSK